MRRDSVSANADKIIIALYCVIVLWGWLNIFAAEYSFQSESIFNLSLNSGKQIIWIAASAICVLVIMLLDYKIFDTVAYVAYGFFILVLLLVLFIGVAVKGNQSWIDFGFFRFQPSEFTKVATALALARYLSGIGIKAENSRVQMIAGAIVGVPAALILLQGDTGSAMVFAVFIIVLYLEGMSPLLLITGIGGALIVIATLVFPELYILIGIGVLAVAAIIYFKKTLKNILSILFVAGVLVGVVYGIDFFMHKLIKPHHLKRLQVLVNPDVDPLGAGWNVNQSKVAIGSGGFWGKGYLQGTQTKGNFVPEQHTDFIFCTVGEESGWVGSLFLITLFTLFIIRVFIIAQRQRSRFARIYGYSVACLFFFHFAVNIAMTIGLFPVVGIPLPFFSYGGSSFLAFTVMLFILVNLDANRRMILG